MARLQQQQAALADLARERALHLGNFEDAARLITGDTLYIDGGYHVID